jgi:signal transduction histidine kinase/DNA-binding response OmpR family regulator/streptogramin lyase
MPLISHRWLILIIVLATGTGLHAQSMKILSTKDGLPQSFVSGIVQDDSSFIWIATRNGLARFDGLQYKVFQHISDDTGSLASNIIIWLEKDAANKIWIELETGEIDRLDPVTEKIRHYLKGNLPDTGSFRFVRRGWLVDSDGDFWGIVKAAGVNRYNTRTKKLDVYNRGNGSLPGDTVRGITETSDRQYWMVSQGVLSLFDKKSNRFSHWPLPFQQDYGVFVNSDAIAINLHERKNGELMWGDRRSIFIFNRKTHRFRTIPLPGISYLGIRWISDGQDASDYFESFGKIYRYSDSLGLMSVAPIITGDFGDAKSFLVDKSGLLWIGTDAGGIKQVDLTTPFFQSSPYKNNFVADVLAQTLGIDMQRVFDWKPEDNLRMTPSYQIRWAYDSRRRLFIGLKATVGYYDSAKKNFTRLAPLPPGTMIAGITMMAEDRPAVVSTTGAILTYDWQQGRWSVFLDPPDLRKKFNQALLAQDMLFDGDAFWMTTFADGLLRIDARTKEVRQLLKTPVPGSTPPITLLGLRADPRNKDILWIGSYEGLIRLETARLTTKIFSVKEGLPDNVIYSMLSDKEGYLWLGTNKGLCRFDPENQRIRVFHTQHGLPGDEFNRFHQLELMDGLLIFGGPEGWTRFDPRLMKTDVFDPVVAFTDLQINNKEVMVAAKKSPLQLPVNATGRLVLSYDQNSVIVSFAGLEFSQPHELRYRYQLEGYDNDWIQAGTSRRAIYTKLPPGDYTLIVNASNISGKWSSHSKTIGITVRPPWWGTTMAYIVYTILLFVLIRWLIHIRDSRLTMQREMAWKEKEARKLKELDDMKSMFFSNMTHEFRTPLTLIMGPAEQLKALHPDDPKSGQLAGTILNNARQLLTLVNRLLDLSRLEANAFQLTEQSGNPGSIVAAVIDSFTLDAATRQLDLALLDDTGHLDVWFHPDALERIVYNLVSNAIKFSPPGGRITVTLGTTDGLLQLEVSDRGIGIPIEKLSYIFNRFYQAEQSGVAADEIHRGSGIGLSMVKELVQQAGGHIKVESLEGKGTSFIVTLPCRNVQAAVAGARSDNAATAITDANGEEAQRILIVEDNAELGAFIAGILSSHYAVDHALNGAAGLEMALAGMPDLVISDVVMPVMDGYEFCRALKEDIRTSHIPVVLLTAKITHDNMMEGLGAGADEYLTKPFHPDALLLRVRNLLASRQKLRERLRQEWSIPGTITADAFPVTEDIFLIRLHEHLDAQLDNESFGVDQLATVMNISRSSLHRKLKSITGLTTTEVIRNYRLRLATDLLRQGFTSQDVAYKTGFGSPAYFSKCFREVYGITPTEFIRQSRN